MKYAVISGDIIAYTSLNKDEKATLESKIQVLLKELDTNFGVFGRILKGDYLECYIPKTEQVLRVALLIKSYVKNAVPIVKSRHNTDNRLRFFQIYGIRLALGIGDLSRLDIEKGIIDGEAIYNTGRLISGKETFDKERVSVKNSLFIKTFDANLDDEFIPLLGLLDKVISEATAKQSEILYYKLQKYNEIEIADLLNISQSAVNQHSTSVGWNAIEKAVLRFEALIKEKIS